MKTSCLSRTFRVLCTSLAIVALSYSVRVSAAPLTELEPNNDASGAIPLVSGFSGFGNISSGADTDNWILPSVHQGDQLFLYLSTITSNTGGDSILQILSSNGTSIAYDDDGGPPSVFAFKASTLTGIVSPVNGNLRAKVDGFGSTTLTPYAFYQIVVRPNEFGVEVEPNNTSGQATPVSAVAYSASAGVDDDYFSFFANAGENIVILVDNNPVDETPLDPATNPVANIVTDIIGVNGSSVLNGTNTTSTRAIGPIPAPSAGTFFARVHKVDGDNLPYTIVVLVEGATPLPGACCNGLACSLKSSTNCPTNFFGAGVSCGGDTDADTYPDACDNCPSTSNNTQVDGDQDGVGDACDLCLSNSQKSAPGQCGCDTPDTDTDNDGTANCNDSCPTDAGKTAPLACGCGVADSDANANSVPDCQKGADLKAQLNKALGLIKKFKANNNKKINELKALTASIKTDANASAAQISLLNTTFPLAKKAGALSKIINNLTKSSGDALKNKKKSASKAVQAIIDAIA